MNKVSNNSLTIASLVINEFEEMQKIAENITFGEYKPQLEYFKREGKKLQEMFEATKNINLEEIDNLFIEFSLSNNESIAEAYRRKNLKNKIPLLKSLYLIKKNGAQIRLTAFELGIMILIICNYKYKNTINKEKFIKEIYPNDKNAKENFKKIKSIFNKKMRNNFGFRLFIKEKGEFLHIDTEKVTKT